jgi:hypothetical protein
MRKNRRDEEARRLNAERRESAARKGQCPRCGHGPAPLQSDPEDAIKVFRCAFCRHQWGVNP